VYIELQPRQSIVPGLAPVTSCHPLPFNFLRIRTEHPARDANPERASRAEGASFPSNPLRIRTSKTPLPEPLYNPHLRRPLGCAGNKGLTGTRIHRQLFCNQYLRAPFLGAGNTGLTILLESALTKNAPATPLESALPRNRGRGQRCQRAIRQAPLSTFHVQTCQRFNGTLPRAVRTPAPPCYPWRASYEAGSLRLRRGDPFEYPACAAV
jgi:hypothetical protein